MGYVLTGTINIYQDAIFFPRNSDSPGCVDYYTMEPPLLVSWCTPHALFLLRRTEMLGLLRQVRAGDRFLKQRHHRRGNIVIRRHLEKQSRRRAALHVRADLALER